VPAGIPLALSTARCWTRVTLSRAVPSSSVSLASMTTCGLNSLGMRLTARVRQGCDPQSGRIVRVL